MNEQLDNSDTQEHFRGRVVTEEIVASELPIQNMSIPNMQMQIPNSGLFVKPTTWIQLINDTAGVLHIRQ